MVKTEIKGHWYKILEKKSNKYKQKTRKEKNTHPGKDQFIEVRSNLFREFARSLALPVLLQIFKLVT